MALRKPPDSDQGDKILLAIVFNGFDARFFRSLRNMPLLAENLPIFVRYLRIEDERGSPCEMLRNKRECHLVNSIPEHMDHDWAAGHNPPKTLTDWIENWNMRTKRGKQEEITLTSWRLIFSSAFSLNDSFYSHFLCLIYPFSCKKLSETCKEFVKNC